MTANGNINNSQGSHSMGFVDSHQITEPNAACSGGKVENLDQALRLAAQLHYGGLQTSEEQLCSLVKEIKRLAVTELEKGDGRKVESVRVERKLDGSVIIFFGI
ncbi:MAG TPA: hypothetical protein V6C89_03625 [Drouetiella sp.]|jgi:hypothetical protein